jgi:hypothetical protein
VLAPKEPKGRRALLERFEGTWGRWKLLLLLPRVM